MSTEAALLQAHRENGDSLEKIVMLGKVEGIRKRGRPSKMNLFHKSSHRPESVLEPL